MNTQANDNSSDMVDLGSAPVNQKPRSFFSAMMSAFPSADELKAGLRQEEVDTVYEVVKILGKLEASQRCEEKMVVVSYLSGDAQKMLTEKGYIVESGSTPGNMCRVKA